MSTPQSTADRRVALFWDNYRKLIHKSGIQPPFDRWFVKRAEAYISTSNKRLAAQGPEDVEAYLREIGRKRGLEGWQFRQIV